MNPKAVLKDYRSNFRSARKQTREDFVFGIRSTYMIMLGVIASLLVYYVWILNVNATQGYNIRQLQTEKRALLLEKELLDVKIAELESLDSILNSDDMQDMEKVENPDYVVIKNDTQYVYNY